ncbi:uncharacterized protein LOC120251327 [Dioscorea cayenensis subsp. rotundata]|uniref:Uncharacterized protein LOC120251327 n=1 Tax=Dioscorea cayennensis subsp. rotundata TaxID=55577 RepID=A0AB40ALI9_DIOCR|nr:uncharacterized protein LOC120251327 [Dioscorea cayenensis subsp. rotundata]
MTRYAKFLKELLTNKRKLQEVSSVTLSEECSSLITNKLPKKEKDPEDFIVPYRIGGLVDEKALADQGASMNLMPYKIFKRLGLGEPKPTIMNMQLVNRSLVVFQVAMRGLDPMNFFEGKRYAKLVMLNKIYLGGQY